VRSVIPVFAEVFHLKLKGRLFSAGKKTSRISSALSLPPLPPTCTRPWRIPSMFWHSSIFPGIARHILISLDSNKRFRRVRVLRILTSYALTYAADNSPPLLGFAKYHRCSHAPSWRSRAFAFSR
jgi:hypothetical protein